MESSTILTADVLDILFEGRNKEYGAYDLRRTYGKRLTLSITVMLSVICMFIIGFAFAGKKTKLPPEFEVRDYVLESVALPEKPVEPPPPPPVKPPAPPAQIKTAIFVTPRIVPAAEVKPDEMPLANDDLENVKIGNVNVPDGKEDDGTVTGPVGDGVEKGIIEPKRDADDANTAFRKVEIESEYPGGVPAWQRFLNRNLRYPQEAIDQEIQGSVVVQFIVDKEGNVSDVEAVSGPQELRAEAVRVIKKSGKWTPAIQNGRQVKSYKRQPIGFRISAE